MSSIGLLLSDMESIESDASLRRPRSNENDSSYCIDREPIDKVILLTSGGV